MATETLHFESARLAQQLYNNEPANLHLMEKELQVKATSREGWIRLEGEESAVERAKQVFVQLEHGLKTGTVVKNRDFSYALEVVQEEGSRGAGGDACRKGADLHSKTGRDPQNSGTAQVY